MLVLKLRAALTVKTWYEDRVIGCAGSVGEEGYRTSIMLSVMKAWRLPLVGYAAVTFSVYCCQGHITELEINPVICGQQMAKKDTVRCAAELIRDPLRSVKSLASGGVICNVHCRCLTRRLTIDKRAFRVCAFTLFNNKVN